MKLAVLKEHAEAERRVAATPETVKKLIALGFEVTAEAGAGEGSSIPDSVFAAAGAKIGSAIPSVIQDADVILKVQADAADLKGAKSGAALIGLVNPYQNQALLSQAAAANITLFALDLVPRITRAQSMDVLSSQSNLAGYKAVIDAAEEFGRAFPMMMTAAGTIAPARVLVMGAGVAGLQAIATARRLGAIVSATDVRPAAKEQVESLGATFLMVESEETKAAETAGGYAKEMSDAYKQKQAQLISDSIAKQDIVICTALIPGRKAPILVTEAMVKSMKPGSVIIDLAVEQGGNCPLSRPGEIVGAHGVKIVGHRNVPSRIAVDASALYARNVLNFVTLLVNAETKQLAFNFEDEILKGSVLTHGGAIVNPNFSGA
jgi:NAD(P) transhydrogenase subunit alpha